MPVIIDILVNDKSWRKHSCSIKSDIRNLLKNVIPQTKLNKFLAQKCTLELSILLTQDKEIQDLNKNYRHKDKPTNVLSFPALSPQEFDHIDPNNNFMVLGDIILSFETILKEASEQGKSFENHLSHLLIHSLLHLIGYDHETEDEAQIMESLEIAILKNLAIDNPYIINSDLLKIS